MSKVQREIADTTGKTPDTTDATANGGGAVSGSDGATTNDEPASTPEPVLSQEQVNALVGQARVKGKETAVKELLGELGVENVEALKQTLEAQKAARLAQMSEVERLQAQLADAQAALNKVNGVEQALEAAENAIIAQVDAQLKRLKVPKYVSDLLGGLSPVEQLNYLSENAENFAKPTAVPDVNGNSRGKGKQAPDEAALRSRYGI